MTTDVILHFKTLYSDLYACSCVLESYGVHRNISVGLRIMRILFAFFIRTIVLWNSLLSIVLVATEIFLPVPPVFMLGAGRVPARCRHTYAIKQNASAGQCMLLKRIFPKLRTMFWRIPLLTAFPYRFPLTTLKIMREKKVVSSQSLPVKV